jgi:hypothetical protein
MQLMSVGEADDWLVIPPPKLAAEFLLNVQFVNVGEADE